MKYKMYSMTYPLCRSSDGLLSLRRNVNDPWNKVHWQCNVHKSSGWTDELSFSFFFISFFSFRNSASFLSIYLCTRLCVYWYGWWCRQRILDVTILSDICKRLINIMKKVIQKWLVRAIHFERLKHIIILIEKCWLTVIKRIDDRSK